MSESRVEPHSLTPLLAVVLIGMIMSLFSGYLLALTFPPLGFSNLLNTILVYMLVPTLTSTIGYIFGWSLKKRAVDYTAPLWDFESIELSLPECKQIAKSYPKKYLELVAASNILYYILPPFLIIFTISFSLYVAEYAPQYLWIQPHIFAPLLGLVYLISILGAFRATANSASTDFTIPPFREILWLAREQSKVPGIGRISIFLERATYGTYEIYSGPRVVIHVKGLEDKALVKSVTTDIGSITRVMAWLAPVDDNMGTIWSWEAHDREFWKQSGSSEFGYYVKRPVSSRCKELGVKDVRLVTQNAIAILLLEWMRLNGDNHEMRELLNDLGVPSDEIDKRF